MLVLVILILLFIVWAAYSIARENRERLRFELRAKELMPEEDSSELDNYLKKTSAFGSFCFWTAMALLIVGIIAILSTIGREPHGLLDACVVGGIFIVPALVLWYIGLRHDHTKIREFYEKQKQRTIDT